MKHILFVLCLVLAFRGCSTQSDDDANACREPLYFNNGSNGELTLVLGNYETISLNGASVNECVFTSSNDEVVSVQTDGSVCYVVGNAEGNATITATLKLDQSKTASLKVTVAQYYKTMKLTYIYWMKSEDEWDNKKYVIYRVRRYRGDEISDGGDAKLQKVDLSNSFDTTSISDFQNLVDNFEIGKWYYIYTNQETGYEIGLFRDSVKSSLSWAIDENCFFDDSSFAISREGAVLSFRDFFMYDNNYSYCLGDRTFVDDVCQVGQDGSLVQRQYQKRGDDLMPNPGYVQCGHFNYNNYTALYQYRFDNDEWPEDTSNRYDFLDEHDSYFYYYYTYTNDEGEEDIDGLYMGYPKAGSEDVCSFFIASDEVTGWFIPAYYNFQATMFKDFQTYGFLTSENYYVDPLQFGDVEEVTFAGGKYPTDKPGKNCVRRETRELPIRTSTLNKQMSVTNTIGATLRMVLTNGK